MADDYMSDAFLVGLNDVRPGLKSRSQKRKDKASEPCITVSKHKRIKASEQEARTKGLATHISTENKGFAMLEKMGYKKGMGLGKNNAGVTTPIPISLKEGKSGLGRERFVKEKVEEKNLRERHRFDDFRQRKQEGFSERRVKADLKKSQAACEQLDCAQGIDFPQESFFWPVELIACTGEEEEREGEWEGDDDDDDKEEEEESSVDQLQVLTEYLRTRYFYCIWCGTAYDDDDDLGRHCPGSTAESHDDD